ncbi:lethal(2) giant larvae protein homolog 1 isoform X2 [Ischnura elegans]|uniref:lethal(2) giant larvae protein homolog 1 isoform X2 n=1 Tax=Ischnura elegans TaxID=197161 RepID=UPI001ED88E08|nr:lethal(2) giant larvae protein homolog 1 isoform X2 [Ischnura elegans]
MLKFIRGKGHQPSAERQRVQRELFNFKKTVHHGFPNKPSALAWDPTLRLMAIGTTSGVIKVIGKPGVEFYGQHQNSESAVTKIVFLPNQGRLVTLCADNSIHLWEINEVNGESTLEETRIQSLEGKLKKISAWHLESSNEHLLLGTEGGNIYLLNVKTFEMAETIIYQDVVMQNVPEDYKKNPGAVEAIAEQPGDPDRILIGYSRGLMVLWNRKKPGADQTYISNQQLESVCWHSSGKKFATSHNDGSYAFWDVDVGDKPTEEPTTLYGPFACKAVTKFVWKPASKDDYMLFSGGMPRSSYSDRHTISVLHGKKHVVFDFTSKVIDFFVIDAVPKESEGSNEGTDGSPEPPEALIVLAEEELIAIDLKSDDWLQLTLPYLAPLHGSAITCVHHVSNVPETLWNKLVAAGKEKTRSTFSDREWPIDGGHFEEDKKETNGETNEETANETAEVGGKDLLLTGHEDGSVRFWDSNGISLKLLYKFSSAELFTSEEGVDSPVANGTNQEEEEEEWPPFRKVGTFDPYSDDPRLAVKKICLCPQSGILAVAGTAGHIVVARIGSEPQADGEIIPGTPELKVITMNIVCDRDGFVWKGHDQLSLRKTQLVDNQTPAGFVASSVLQLHPPAAVTSLALHAQWGLVAAGTAHGLALFDYKRAKPVLTKCTLNPNDLSGAGDAPISRRKSFKKSLRESFRRLRKGRSQRNPAGEKRGSAAGSSSPGGPSDRKRKDPDLEEQDEPPEGAEDEGVMGGGGTIPASSEPAPASQDLTASTNGAEIAGMPEDAETNQVPGASGSGEVAVGDAAVASSPTSPASTSGMAAPLSPVEARPIERQVEARPLEDSLGSMVRCLSFARSFIVSAQTTTPTLWAGTNNGTVFVFTITVPNWKKRMEEDVSCQLGKEIQLKHRAPVISITVVDGSAVPLPEPLEIENGIAPQPDNSAPHKVLICSEEQFKLFSLPSLKPLGKLKLTAHEGARVRRVGYARFYAPHSAQSTSTPYSETCLLSLTNLGDLIVLSLPDLRRQLVSSCIRREDINGISSLAFTRFGEAFYLHSSSELQRVTLSATKVTKTNCSLKLPEGARPTEATSEPVTSPVGDRDLPAEEEDKGVVLEGVVKGEASEESKDQDCSAPSSEAVAANDVKPELPKPTVNGDVDEVKNKDSSVESHVEMGKVIKKIEVTTTVLDSPKENGGNIEDEDLHELTGDITIDSVKDHLISSMNEDAKIIERKTEKFEMSTSKMESSVIVKTTTISSSEVATVVNSTGETVGQDESPNRTEALPSRSVLNESL